MNIVDVIKGQLGGEVLGKLSSLIGEGEDTTRARSTRPYRPCSRASRAWPRRAGRGQADQRAEAGGRGLARRRPGGRPRQPRAGRRLARERGKPPEYPAGLRGASHHHQRPGQVCRAGGGAAQEPAGLPCAADPRPDCQTARGRGADSPASDRLLRRAGVEHRRRRPAGILTCRHLGPRDVSRGSSDRRCPRCPGKLRPDDLATSRSWAWDSSEVWPTGS